MGLGLSGDFIIFAVISILLAVATNNWLNGVVLFGIYAGVKIVWGILTN